MPQIGSNRIRPNFFLRFMNNTGLFDKNGASRLFFNEIPKPKWFMKGTRASDNDTDLYSFTKANQKAKCILGYDTTTPEGRESYKKEMESIAKIAPEMLNGKDVEDIVYPHEMPNN